MKLLFENPIPLAAICGLMAAMLMGGFFQTQRKSLLLGAGGMLLLLGGVVFIERVVVTPSEEVAQTLHEIASDLEVNNIEGVLRHISTTAPELEHDARGRLRGVTLEQVKIKRNLSVDVTPPSDPTAANARFNCVVVGSDKSGMMGKRKGAFYFDVKFLKEQGSWRVASYEMKDFREGMRRENQ